MIGEREIHIWLACTDGSADAIRALETVLDAEERAKAARFHFDADRRRAIVARATLRRLLGRYLGRPPHELSFVFGPQGKPALDAGSLEFNVSHSGDYVALAFALGSPLGVDVESELRASDLLALADRFFSPVEAEIVRNAPDVAHAFFKTWTAKESVIKAVGGGLSIDLTSFRVAPEPDRFTAVENRGGHPHLDDWFVQLLPRPADGYQASVAIRGADWTTIVRSAAEVDLGG